jgi:hypothetical protein
MPALQCSLGCQPPVSDVMWQSVDAERVVAAEWRQTLSEGTVGGEGLRWSPAAVGWMSG